MLKTVPIGCACSSGTDIYKSSMGGRSSNKSSPWVHNTPLFWLFCFTTLGLKNIVMINFCGEDFLK